MDNVLPDSHIGMEWLISHMPEEDLKTLSSEFLINNCELAYEARKSKRARTTYLPTSYRG